MRRDRALDLVRTDGKAARMITYRVPMACDQTEGGGAAGAMAMAVAARQQVMRCCSLQTAYLESSRMCAATCNSWPGSIRTMYFRLTVLTSLTAPAIARPADCSAIMPT